MGEEINIYIKTLLEGIAVPCVIFLTQIIVRFVTTYMNKIKEQQKNEELNKYFDIVQDAIVKSVLTTNQVFVDNLKGQNLFDEDAQKQAYEQTRDNVLAIITDSQKALIESAVGDFEKWLKAQIEAQVAAAKKAKANEI